MNYLSRIRKLISNPPGRNDPLGRLMLIAGIGALYLLILFTAKLYANKAPFLSVALSWIWFLLPGLLVSLSFLKKCTWWERIPLAFVLSIGLATPWTLIAILLHLSLDILIMFHAETMLGVVIFLLLYEIRRQAKPPEILTSPYSNSTSKPVDKISIALLVVLVALVGILTFLAMVWPMAGDDIAGMAIFAEVLDKNQITGTEPFHGSGVPVTPRNELIVATYLEILIDKVSGTLPPEFIQYSRPMLIILGILSLAVFLSQILKDSRQVLFLLCLWGIYLLATLQGNRTGSDFTTRIFQDKFLGWFVIIPGALVFMLWLLEERNWQSFIELSLVCLGAAMVHPITLVQLMIIMGGFGFVHLAIERSRGVFINLIVIAGVLLFSTVIPFLEYLRYNNVMPIDLAGLSTAVEFGRLSAAVSQYRLWLLDGGRFILHPSIIFAPIIMVAYAILPIIILKIDQSYLFRIITGTLLILPVLLYIPSLSALVGKVVTPYLIWRVAWPFPLFAILAIGSIVWLVVRKIEARFTSRVSRTVAGGILYPGLIVLSLLIAKPNISAGLVDYREQRSQINCSMCIKVIHALSFLQDYTDDQSVNVLSSHNLNFCIPGYVANANVVEFRGYGTINRLSIDNVEDSVQRVDDVYYFDSVRLIDDRVMNIIIHRNIDFILIEKDKVELNFQFNNLPTHFQRIYTDADFELYHVIRQAQTPAVIHANTALQARQYENAKESFTQILQGEPTNILANMGMGLVEDGLGNNEQAIKYYQAAIQNAPNEPALHAQLASTYLVKRDIANAALEYQSAIQLSTEIFTLYKEIGEINILLGRDQDALISFEKFAALQALEGSASYYSILGRSLQYTERMTDEAIQYQEKAISIQTNPQHFIDLARSLAYSGETDQAIEVLNQAITLDRWSYLPQLELGYFYMKQGHIDEAIEKFELACRLNPANISTFISLGMAIKEKSGLDAAVKRIEELKNLNNVLPGPYRSYAVLMATSGNFEDALKALDISTTIQPRSAAILTAKGYISIIDGQMDAADAAFDEALLSYPDLISAHLGLGLYYKVKANYQMQTTQLLQIIPLMPTESWIRLDLAEAYMYLGDAKSALDESTWAINLDPRNAAGYIMRGDINRTELNWEPAISDYSTAHELDPQNTNALIGLGDIYRSLADYSNAEKYYLQAVDADEASVDPKVRLANLYWQLGMIDKAVAMEDTLAKMAPDSDLVLIRTANNYKMQGRIGDAESVYYQVIQTYPDEISAYITLALLMEGKDVDFNTIFTLYNQMLSANQGSAEANLAAGQFFTTQGQYDIAENVYQVALTYPDVSIDNYLALADLQAKLGKQDEEIKTLNAAINRFPGQAMGFYSLGYYYLTAGEIDKANIYFDRAIILKPSLIIAYEGKSQVEQIRGNLDNAETILQSAVQKNSGSSEAYLALGEFQESFNKLDLAEKNINKALGINASDIDTNQAAALFYMRQKRYTEALDIFHHALSLPGSKLEIYLQMGNLEMARLQTDEAMHWYQAANVQDQSDARPYLSLANLYQSKWNFTAAYDTLTTAFHMQPANVEVNLALGGLSNRLGNFDDARKYFERALRLDYSNVASLIALAEFAKNHEDWKQAIAYLEEAKRLQPANFLVYNQLAEIYQLMDNYSKAEDELLSGYQDTVEKQSAYLGLASLDEKRGFWNIAQEYYELALSQEPYSKSTGLAYVDFLERRNEDEKALAVLQQLEDRLGADAEIYIAYGDIFSSQVKWPEASTAYKHALELDAGAKEGYLGLASIYIEQGDMQAAIDLYQLALGNVVDSVELHTSLGTALWDQAKLVEAQAVFQKAVDSSPYNLIAMVSLEQINKILDAPELDLAGYVQPALQAPSSIAFTTIAQLYQLRGEWTLAHSWYQRAINLEPNKSQNWFLLGNYYESQAQWEKALEEYNQALKYDPNSPAIVLAIGTIQENLGHLEAAQESYQHAIEISPSIIDGYIALAELELIQEDPEKALGTIQEGIIQAPRDYRGYETLGEIYTTIDPENIEQAETAYRTGLNVVPGESGLYISIGELYTNQVFTAWQNLTEAEMLDRLTKNRYEALLVHFGITGEDLSQQSRFVQDTVGEARLIYDQSHQKLLVAQDKYEQSSVYSDMATASYSNALALNPNTELAVLGMGKLQLAHGLEAEAVSYFEYACAMHPYSSSALSYLGNSYQDLGRTEEALNVFEQIIALDPGNSSAKAALVGVYHDLTSLTIYQAATSVEQGAFKLETLVDNLRKMEILELK